MVTYGDMVTLLLTFFVLLLAMSEVKKEDQFVDFMEAIRSAFGYVGGVKQVPMEDIQVPRNVPLSKMLIVPIEFRDFSKSRDPGVRGTHDSTRDNRPEEVFVVGGRIEFPQLSAELVAEEAERILQLCEELRGVDTMLKLTGHCSRRPVEGSAFASHFDLAYTRAKVVRDALVRAGVAAERILIEVAGTNQPVAQRSYTAWDRQRNDLVEIMQLDSRAYEYTP